MQYCSRGLITAALILAMSFRNLKTLAAILTTMATVALLTAGGCRRRAEPTASGPLSAVPHRTNVLLITIDTLRADHLGAYGYPRATSPNIDALAAEGRVFDNAFAIYPRTGPSVASILTGAFPVKIHDWRIPAGVPTLASILAASGYDTTAVLDNANLSRSHGYGQGFETFRETWKESRSEIDRTRLISSAAIEELERLQGQQKPFLMWLHFVNPHGPYAPPAEYASLFEGDPWYDPKVIVPHKPFPPGDDAYLASEPRLAPYVAKYDGEIRFADAEIGRVLAFLRRLPAFPDTLIVVTADHGEMLGEWGLYFMHGPALDRADLHVPLIFSQKNQIRKARIKAPALLIDVVPSILDWVSVKVPSELRTPFDGESLIGLTEASEDSPHPYLFFASNDYWGVRSHDYQLNIQTRDNPQYALEPVALFNLRIDPNETKNLIKSNPDTVARLKNVLVRRRAVQNEAAESNDARFGTLSKEALENLRSLGYIR